VANEAPINAVLVFAVLKISGYNKFTTQPFWKDAINFWSSKKSSLSFEALDVRTEEENLNTEYEVN
jgi:hypothetical protein